MKLGLRPTPVERLVKAIALSFVAIIGLQILWSLVAPWLPLIALGWFVLVVLRLWWWRYCRW